MGLELGAGGLRPGPQDGMYTEMPPCRIFFLAKTVEIRLRGPDFEESLTCSFAEDAGSCSPARQPGRRDQATKRSGPISACAHRVLQDTLERFMWAP